MSEFIFHLADGTEVRTGNIVPETMPLSFEQSPDSHLRSLDEIVDLASNPSRFPARQKFAQYVDQMNQGNASSCNPYMIGWMMSVLKFQFTGTWNRLSPEWTYMNINGGRDQGSLLDKGMVFATDFGMPAYNPKLYEKYNANQLDMETQRFAKDSSVDHRFGECYQAPRQDVTKCWHSLISCVAGGGVVGLAVHVGNRYLNQSGVIAGYDRGPGNHAVAGVELALLKKQPASVADIAIVSPQTWGSRFADRGFTNLTINHIAETMRYHALYCVRTVCATRDEESKTKLST